jgi:hypothetical protein
VVAIVVGRIVLGTGVDGLQATSENPNTTGTKTNTSFKGIQSSSKIFE